MYTLLERFSQEVVYGALHLSCPLSHGQSERKMKGGRVGGGGRRRVGRSAMVACDGWATPHPCQRNAG